MNLIKCPQCSVRVAVTADGSCPSCRAQLHDGILPNKSEDSGKLHEVPRSTFSDQPLNPYQPTSIAGPHSKPHGLILGAVKFVLAILPSIFICWAVLWVLFRVQDRPEPTRHLILLIGIGAAIPLAIFFASRRTWKTFTAWCGGGIVVVYLLVALVRLFAG